MHHVDDSPIAAGSNTALVFHAKVVFGEVGAARPGIVM